VRDAFESVVQIWGLDLNRSFKFWDPYMKFEKEQLEKIQDKDSEEFGKQIGRIRSIYRRRVIFPTTDMLVTW
jgi:hypothetical protein